VDILIIALLLVSIVAIAVVAWKLFAALTRLEQVLNSVDTLITQVDSDLRPSMQHTSEATKALEQILTRVDRTLSDVDDVGHMVSETLGVTTQETWQSIRPKVGRFYSYYVGIRKGWSVLKAGTQQAKSPLKTSKSNPVSPPSLQEKPQPVESQ